MRLQDLGIVSLFERIRDAAIVADAKTRQIVLWNPAAANIFGYSASEALEMRVEALVPEYLKDQHRAGPARYAETGHQQQGCVRSYGHRASWEALKGE